MPFHTQGASAVELHWMEELIRAEAAGGQVIQHLARQCQDQQLQNVLQGQIRRTQQNIQRLMSVVQSQNPGGSGGYQATGYQATGYQGGAGGYQTQGYLGGTDTGERRNWTT